MTMHLTIYTPEGDFCGIFGVDFDATGRARVTDHRSAFDSSRRPGAPKTDREEVLASIERALYRANVGMAYDGIESRTRTTPDGWRVRVDMAD